MATLPLFCETRCAPCHRFAAPVKFARIVTTLSKGSQAGARFAALSAKSGKFLSPNWGETGCESPGLPRKFLL